MKKELIIKDHAPWFNAEILREKKEKRKKERLCCRLRTDAAKRDEIKNKI